MSHTTDWEGEGEGGGSGVGFTGLQSISLTLVLLWLIRHLFVRFAKIVGAPVAQWVKRWPTELASRVRSPLEAKSSQT